MLLAAVFGSHFWWIVAVLLVLDSMWAACRGIQPCWGLLQSLQGRKEVAKKGSPNAGH